MKTKQTHSSLNPKSCFICQFPAFLFAGNHLEALTECAVPTHNLASAASPPQKPVLTTGHDPIITSNLPATFDTVACFLPPEMLPSPGFSDTMLSCVQPPSLPLWTPPFLSFQEMPMLPGIQLQSSISLCTLPLSWFIHCTTWIQ